MGRGVGEVAPSHPAPTGQAVLKGVNIDDWFFGVSALGPDGS